MRKAQRMARRRWTKPRKGLPFLLQVWTNIGLYILGFAALRPRNAMATPACQLLQIRVSRRVESDHKTPVSTDTEAQKKALLLRSMFIHSQSIILYACAWKRVLIHLIDFLTSFLTQTGHVEASSLQEAELRTPSPQHHNDKAGRWLGNYTVLSGG